MNTEPHASSRHAGEPHARSENNRLNRLRAGVLGANDGIVSVSAMLLGMVGAGTSNAVILTAGLASTIAGAVSMGLGEYVSVSAQRDTERVLIGKESDELHEMPDEERDELAGILQGYGISPETAAQAAQEISDGDPLPAHLRLELGLDTHDLVNPWSAAGSSALSFVLGAALPMLSVLLSTGALQGFVLTVVTLVALACTGFASAKMAGTSVRRSMVRLVVGGAAGLAVTYGVGVLFGASA
ncbi:VIT1/CCC1 transporter family protein [Corynebacterium nuruki]|uniref:VIT1/CCC1 transporter family protein n=1 Tax=Corynebacterium nuruki TaxID=1032851 RepID=UPI00024857BF|nr:VIT family protein [Corynebacterium nuruki]